MPRLFTHPCSSHLSPQGCLELARALAYSVSLRRLAASHTGWDDVAVGELCCSLATCVTLTALDLGWGR